MLIAECRYDEYRGAQEIGSFYSCFITPVPREMRQLLMPKKMAVLCSNFIVIVANHLLIFSVLPVL
jgi:hypothetical protein